MYRCTRNSRQDDIHIEAVADHPNTLVVLLLDGFLDSPGEFGDIPATVSILNEEVLPGVADARRLNASRRTVVELLDNTVCTLTNM